MKANEEDAAKRFIEKYSVVPEANVLIRKAPDGEYRLYGRTAMGMGMGFCIPPTWFVYRGAGKKGRQVTDTHLLRELNDRFDQAREAEREVKHAKRNQ